MDKNNIGLTFILVLVIILVVTLMAGAFMVLSMNEVKAVRRQNDSTRVFYLAEAGIENARAQLGASWSNQTAIQNDTLGEGAYAVNFYTTDAAGAALPLYQLRVRSAGTVNGVSRIVEVVLGSASRFDGSAYVTSAIEAEGGLDLRGSAEIEGEIKAAISTSLTNLVFSGSSTIDVDDTGNLSVNDTILVDAGTAQEESGTIISIDEVSSSLTLEEGLTFDHDAGADIDRILSFENIFGVSKEEMREIAQEYFPATYYSSAFDNDSASGLTWVNAVGVESQITSNGWSGDGILVVEGNLKITGGTFNGVIWVDGTLTVSGNPEIYGGIFVESGITVDTTITGTADISYDADSIDDAFLNVTSISPTVDSWREVY